MAQTDIIQLFKQLDTSSSLFPDQLTSLLYQKEYEDRIPNLPDEDVFWLVNYLDDVLESLQANTSSPAFRRCLRKLGKVCGARQQLPQSYILDGSLSNLGECPTASRGSGDVYEGFMNGSRVCVKRIQIYAGADSPGSKKTFYRDVVIWKRLTHPNIVPFFGVTLKPVQLISACTPGGEIKEYIAGHPSTNRLRLLFGVADGLNYLHCRNIVHGDLRGPNIIVDDAGCPRIADFGLTMVSQDDHDHTLQWTAPEILNSQGTYSKEADVFSFAMVMVEVFTGQVPFHPSSPAVATIAISIQERPARPTHPQCTNELWKAMEACWEHDPLRRPEISKVLNTFRSSLLDSNDSETTESLESLQPDKDHEQISGTDKPQPASQGESTPHLIEARRRKMMGSVGEILSNYSRTDPGVSRRSSCSSEMPTPLRVDPSPYSINHRRSPRNDYDCGSQNPSGNYPRNSNRSQLDFPDLAELRRAPQFQATDRNSFVDHHYPPSYEVVELPSDWSVLADSIRNTSENEPSPRTQDVATPGSEGDRGIWYQIKRFLICSWDEDMPSQTP